MTTNSRPLQEQLQAGKEFFENELKDITEKVKVYARDCAVNGKPHEFGDSLLTYVQSIRTWFWVLHDRIGLVMRIDGLENHVIVKRNEYRQRISQLHNQTARLRTKLASHSSDTVPDTHVERLSLLLVIAHAFIAFTEAATISNALQLFGGTMLISAIACVSLFVFFYFLPILILRLIDHVTSKRRRIMLAALFALLISGLFWFLGTLRASYAQEVSSDGMRVLGTGAYIVFNWMFLCLSMYLMYRRKELQPRVIHERHQNEQRMEHLKSAQELTDTANSLKEVEREARQFEDDAEALRSGFRAIEHLLITHYHSAVEEFKTINLSLRDNVVPDCFSSTVPPLFRKRDTQHLPTIT